MHLHTLLTCRSEQCVLFIGGQGSVLQWFNSGSETYCSVDSPEHKTNSMSQSDGVCAPLTALLIQICTS